MVGYLIQTTGLSNGVYSDKMSESIGSYSYTKKANEDMLGGYPKAITGKIERYQSTK